MKKIQENAKNLQKYLANYIDMIWNTLHKSNPRIYDLHHKNKIPRWSKIWTPPSKTATSLLAILKENFNLYALSGTYVLPIQKHSWLINGTRLNNGSEKQAHSQQEQTHARTNRRMQKKTGLARQILRPKKSFYRFIRMVHTLHQQLQPFWNNLFVRGSERDLTW